MEYEHMFVQTDCEDAAQRPSDLSDGAASCDATERMAALVDHLDRFVAEETSRRQIFRTLSPDTKLAGMIYDRAGRILWLGRNQLLANAAQRLAVAVRDGGCFQCGAPMHRCELHHIREWHRDRGRTDIRHRLESCSAPG